MVGTFTAFDVMKITGLLSARRGRKVVTHSKEVCGGSYCVGAEDNNRIQMRKCLCPKEQSGADSAERKENEVFRVKILYTHDDII